MRVPQLIASLGLLASVVSAPAFAANYAVPGNSGESCLQTCNKNGGRAVQLGRYTADGGNRPFLVCGGQGSTDVRPGFQLPGFDNNACFIADGQDGVQAFNYNCLCSNT